VRQEALAVRKHSKCGRPSDVYRYHHIDAESVVEACGKVLSETALENVVSAGQPVANGNGAGNHDWRELWPAEKQ
jgi:pyruvate dehydrogenase E1 component